MSNVTIDHTNGIVLQINEATRTITNGGKDTPIILGVKGDHCAERIYFESPNQLSQEIKLLENTDTVKTRVYVNYKNAMHDVYIQECEAVEETETSGTVRFSWLVTNAATEAKGEVKFNVCVKRTTLNDETGDWDLTSEWHTTMFVGKVLDSVDVSRTTTEVITYDSITFDTIMQDYEAYTLAYNTWSKAMADVDANVVGPMIDEKMVNYALKSEYLPLTGGTVTGDINMTNGHGLRFTNGGFGSADDGWPIIYSNDGSVLIVGGDTTPRYIEFPTVTGKLALIEEVEASKNVSTELFSSSEKEATCILASDTENGVSRLRVILDDEPSEGSKLKIYIHSKTLDGFIPSLMNNSFVIEMPIMKHPYHDRITGQASHYIVSYNIQDIEDDVVGDAFPITFEGIMHVSFDPNGLGYPQSDTLVFTLITKSLTIEQMDQGIENLLSFCIDRIEMITGTNI